MIGTITLNPSIDTNITVHGLAKDDTNRARSISETAGGKGINVSKVVRELGGKTRAYALLGGFPGEYLKQLAVPLDFPLVCERVSGNTRMNLVVTDVKDGTQTRISAPGPVINSAETARFLRRLLAVRPRPAFWALGGSVPPGMKPSVYRDLVWALQKAGTPCVMDTDDEALQLGVAAKPFMIKPNEYEMQRLCGYKPSSVAGYTASARQLVRSGIRLVIVSLGPKGAVFATEKETFHALSPKVAVKSKVGAGDSLIGGVVLALSRGQSLEEAARLGIAASTSAVMREAPRLCRKSDIRGLLKRVKIKRL